MVEFCGTDALVSPALPQQPSNVIDDDLLTVEVILYWIQVAVAVGVIVGVIVGVTVLVGVIVGVIVGVTVLVGVIVGVNVGVGVIQEQTPFDSIDAEPDDTSGSVVEHLIISIVGFIDTPV
jgi:hypothetical protein